MNLQRMKDFLRKFINNKYKNNLIIMDNGVSHKKVKKYVNILKKIVINYNIMFHINQKLMLLKIILIN